MEASQFKIAVLGLGYVGLPLAVEFSKYFPVIGFDINRKRVGELQAGSDITLEVSEDQMSEVVVTTAPNIGSKGLYCSYDMQDMVDCNVYIITVPTPVDKNNRPDLTPLYKASESVGKVLKIGDYVIYESTVYPGVTEDECVPVLERVSGLKFNVDFYCGYSPERINPGDKLHTVAKIKKVTSGSTPEVADIVNNLYATIITAGTFKAASIKAIIKNAPTNPNVPFKLLLGKSDVQ
jgi:UDP-N-acetyl-D-galactosamine dehydrogenase